MVRLNLPTCPHCGKIVEPVPEGHSLVCFGHGLIHFNAKKVELIWNPKTVKKWKQFMPSGSKPPKDTGELRHSLPRWRRR